MDQFCTTNEVLNQSKQQVCLLLVVCRDNSGTSLLCASNQALSWWQCPSSLVSSEGVGPHKMNVVFIYLKTLSYKKW